MDPRGQEAMNIVAEVICGESAAKCVCEEDPHHAGPHVCQCGGSWIGKYDSDSFEILRLPNLSWEEVGPLAL